MFRFYWRDHRWSYMYVFIAVSNSRQSALRIHTNPKVSSYMYFVIWSLQFEFLLASISFLLSWSARHKLGNLMRTGTAVQVQLSRVQRAFWRFADIFPLAKNRTVPSRKRSERSAKRSQANFRTLLFWLKEKPDLPLSADASQTFPTLAVSKK